MVSMAVLGAVGCVVCAIGLEVLGRARSFSALERKGVVLVLGCTQTLMEFRVRRSVQLRPSTVVFSGGFGEAEMMNFLFGFYGGNVEDTLRITENNSRTTFENAQFSAVEVANNKIDDTTVTLVSDGFHYLRAVTLFKRAFPQSEIRFVSSNCPLFLIVFKWCMREVFALGKGLWKGHYHLRDLAATLWG